MHVKAHAQHILHAHKYTYRGQNPERKKRDWKEVQMSIFL